MLKKIKPRIFADVNKQAANALLRSIFEFLESNQFSKKSIVAMAQKYGRAGKKPIDQKAYKQLVAAYDDMGAILSTWFSTPDFTDSEGRPIPILCRKESKIFARLLRLSGTQASSRLIVELMQQSPSFKTNSDGSVTALRRLFILADFRVPRAAFNVERYLDTVRKSGSTRRSGAVALLERSSYVSKIDLAQVAPFLRSIEGRGTAFMDSIDGEIEAKRLRRLKSKDVGELGVSIFAWTKPGMSRASEKRLRRSS